MVKWFSYAYVHIFFFNILFHSVYHRVLNIVPCATQYELVFHLFFFFFTLKDQWQLWRVWASFLEEDLTIELVGQFLHSQTQAELWGQNMASVALGPLGCSRPGRCTRPGALTVDRAETDHWVQMRLTSFLFSGTLLTWKITGEMFTSRVWGTHSNLTWILW